jgi:CRP/FNR family transcriptional regulator, cyclic AMP receptor protein
MLDIHDVPLFEGLTDAEFSLVQDVAQVRENRAGEVLVREGDDPDGLYILASGAVKVSKLGEDGNERTIAVLGPGEVLGEMTIFGDQPRSADVVALAPSTLYVIPLDRMRELLLQIPTLAMRVIEILSERLREAGRLAQEVAFYDARRRTVAAICRLMDGQGSKDGESVLVEATPTEVAKAAALARETANVVMSELMAEGKLKTGRGRFWVLRPEDLRAEIQY